MAAIDVRTGEATQVAGLTDIDRHVDRGLPDWALERRQCRLERAERRLAQQDRLDRVPPFSNQPLDDQLSLSDEQPPRAHELRVLYRQVGAHARIVQILYAHYSHDALAQSVALSTVGTLG